MAEFMLHIDGMHCGACVKRVTQALAAVGGVAIGEVTVGTARLSSALDPPPVDQAVTALAKAGYTARLEP